MSKTWSESYSVHTYELDRRQRVSVRAIGSYLIDTAGEHVHEIGFSIPKLLERQRSWFFSRFLLRMEAYPGWRETISVETWPSGQQKLLTTRDWRLFNGQRLIGLATSGWLMIDIGKRRPLRPESYPEWKQHLHPERAIPHIFAKLPELSGSQDLDGPRFRVRYQDVDINGHANYLSYIDWILESIPHKLLAQGEMAELELHFLREANLGEELQSYSRSSGQAPISAIGKGSAQPAAGIQHLHSLRRGEVELARARTVWKTPAERSGS